jgi:hypothetical protein
MTAIDFTLTEEEAAVAGARAAWRISLADGLLARHLAPLAAFFLALTFAAILGLTGLVSRRAAEIALIGAAAAYMIYRLWTRRRFLAARRLSAAWAQEIRRAGPARLILDDAGFRLTGAGLDRAWTFAEGLEVESVSGLVYVWPHAGLPLVWPSRAHVDAQEAEAFLALVRQRTGAKPPPAAAPDDDD